jgi:O-antigen ligase
MTKIRNAWIYLAVLMLCLPLTIFSFNGIDLPLSDLLCVAGVFLSLRYINLLFARLLYLSIVLSLISSIFVALFIAKDFDFRPLYSIIYFFKPYFSIFIAFYIIKNKDDFYIFCKATGNIVFLILLLIMYSIIFNHNGLVRNESDLNGSIFGIGLYGSYGVNSLAVYYLLLYFIILFSGYIEISTSIYFKFARIASLWILSYLIFFSLSREAILGYVALISWYFFLYKSGPMKKIVIFFIMSIGLLSILSLDSTSDMWESKTTQIVESVQQGDLDRLSSGRIGLYIVALDQLKQNPVFGNGFHGFQLYTDAIEGFDTVEGLSPHNQYITTIWKMGLLAAIPYFLALIILYRKTKILRGTVRYKFLCTLLFVVFFILANVWDVFIIPNFSALLFFFWGAVIKSADVKRYTYNEQI